MAGTSLVTKAGAPLAGVLDQSHCRHGGDAHAVADDHAGVGDHVTSVVLAHGLHPKYLCVRRCAVRMLSAVARAIGELR